MVGSRRSAGRAFGRAARFDDVHCPAFARLKIAARKYAGHADPSYVLDRPLRRYRVALWLFTRADRGLADPRERSLRLRIRHHPAPARHTQFHTYTARSAYATERPRYLAILIDEGGTPVSRVRGDRRLS